MLYQQSKSLLYFKELQQQLPDIESYNFLKVFASTFGIVLVKLKKFKINTMFELLKFLQRSINLATDFHVLNSAQILQFFVARH